MGQAAAACLMSFLLTPGCIQLAANINDIKTKNNALAILGNLLTASQSKFLAFTNTNVLYESSGNGTWIAKSFSGAARITDVANLNGTLFGINSAVNNTLYKSLDNGVTWTSQTVSGVLGPNIYIAACNGTIVILYTNTGTYGLYSTNGGSSWSGPVTVDGNSTSLPYDLICNSSSFYVVVGSGSQLVKRSPTGAVWTDTVSFTGIPVASSTSRLATDNSTNVFYVYQSTNAESNVSSNSAVNFTSVTSFTTAGSYSGGVFYANGNFFLGTFTGTSCTINKSASGTNGSWTTTGTTCPASTALRTGSSTSSAYFLAGDAGAVPVIIRSTDAINWSREALPTSAATGIVTSVVVP